MKVQEKNKFLRIYRECLIVHTSFSVFLKTFVTSSRKMARFWIPFCTAPAATKHAPKAGLMGVGSGNMIMATPIFISLGSLPARHNFLVASTSRAVPFKAPNRSVQLSFSSFKVLVAVFVSSFFIGYRASLLYSVILEQKNFNVLKGVASSFFCFGKLAFFIEALKFDASDSDVFAANRQFRQLFET
jgi:hypothetical protein